MNKPVLEAALVARSGDGLGDFAMKTMTVDQLVEVFGKVTFLLKRDMSSMDFAEIQKWIDDANRSVRLVSGEIKPLPSEPTRQWREADGVIYFSVVSDGTTGEQWIARLEGKNLCVGDYAKQVLRHEDFKPTSGVLTEVAVLKGMLFENSDRITSKIRAEADMRTLQKPNAEIACLIREKFTDEEIEAMGIWYIIAMHEPIKDSDGDLSLLDADRGGDGRWLGACGGRPDCRWDRDDGFAFAVSQVSSSI